MNEDESICYHCVNLAHDKQYICLKDMLVLSNKAVCSEHEEKQE